MTKDGYQVWHPLVTLKEENDKFAAFAFVPGVDAHDVEIWMAPDVMLIKGQTRRGDRRLLRSIRFPIPVNPDDVQAGIDDGLLCIWGSVADGLKIYYKIDHAIVK